MVTKDTYEPCFTTIPNTTLGRWKLLREFARRWHGVSLGSVGVESSLVKQEQTRLGVNLPLSFREYIAFADELIAQNAFRILRDGYRVRRLDEHSATSLLLISENDVYWAVKDEFFADDDPPVDIYFLDYDNDKERRFIGRGTRYPSITSFVLEHMAHFLYGKGGGFCVRVELTDANRNEMYAVFPVTSQMDNIQIFEKKNIVVFLISDINDNKRQMMHVNFFRPIPTAEIPECLKACTSNGGCFHGEFANKS
ncbi:MAG: hypothetical protein F6J87_28750 [Spirulina sp. SIO3F2]|nr:hypothetical protein [Spirulina sp. SIO3F2]